MDEFHRHVFGRLDNVEAELHELRQVTWPVCQGLLDGQGVFVNIENKRAYFRFLDIDVTKQLLKLKAVFMGRSPELATEELRQIIVTD